MKNRLFLTLPLLASAGWDGRTLLWGWDERRQRNINPEAEEGDPIGDEESEDEEGRPLPSSRRRSDSRCDRHKKPRLDSRSQRSARSETDRKPASRRHARSR